MMGDYENATDLEKEVVDLLKCKYEETIQEHYRAAKELIKIIKYSTEARNFYTWK